MPPFSPAVRLFQQTSHVHVKIWPRPLNLSESTDVLRVLQRYGEVAMFKHLKHEPNVRAHNSALAIFKSPDAAKKVLAASPIRFVYGQVRNQEIGHGFEELGGRSDDAGAVGACREQTHAPAARGETGSSQADEERQLLGDTGAKEELSLSSNDERAAEHDEAVDSGSGPGPISLAWPPMTIDRPRPTPQSSSLQDLESSLGLDDYETFPSNGADASPSATRACTISVQPSALDHQAYVSRQHYYHDFRTEPPAYPGLSLLGQLPLGMRGLANFDLSKGESPFRRRRNHRAVSKDGFDGLSLQEAWQKGAEKRVAKESERVAAEKRGWKGEGDVGLGDRGYRKIDLTGMESRDRKMSS